MTLKEHLKAIGLTNREIDVAYLTAFGLSNREIGNEIFLSESTVKFHLTNVYKKLTLESRAKLMYMCFSYMRQEELEGFKSARTIYADDVLAPGLVGL